MQLLPLQMSYVIICTSDVVHPLLQFSIQPNDSFRLTIADKLHHGK